MGHRNEVMGHTSLHDRRRCGRPDEPFGEWTAGTVVAATAATAAASDANNVDDVGDDDNDDDAWW